MGWPKLIGILSTVIVSVFGILFVHYTSKEKKIEKLTKEVQEITNEILRREKGTRNYSNLSRLSMLYDKRLSLNRAISRLRGK